MPIDLDDGVRYKVATDLDPGASVYRLARWSAYAAGADRALLFLGEQGTVLESDRSALVLLGRLQGARTIDGHVEQLCQGSLAGTAAAPIRAALDALVRSGLLRRVESARPPARASKAAVRIETVGIVTADRPELVARGLADGVAHTRRYDRRVRFIVVDGSQDRRNQRRTRAACKSVAGDARVCYVGREQIRHIISRLLASGADQRLLASALRGGTAGANRNVLSLVTAGRSLLMVDDDVRWQTWRLRDLQPQPVFAGHDDERELAFFATREEAVGAAMVARHDLLDAHESLLGKDMRSLATEGADLSGACAHLLQMLAADRPAVVRVTQAGVAGDAGWHCPYRLLLQDAPARSLRESSARLGLALSSREIHRIARRPTITHDPNCMALCMGIANTDVMPPFTTMGRNEDGVFGALLAFADRRALFGHLPWGTLHDSDRPGVRQRGDIPSADSTRLAEVLLALVEQAAGLAAPRSVAAGCGRLARMGAEVCDLPRDEFREYLTQLLVQVRSRELLKLESAMLREPSCPAHWRGALEQYHERLVTGVLRHDFFCPIEFARTGGPDAPWTAVQRWLAEFFELLGVWPDVWERSSQLDEEERASGLWA